MFGWLVVSREGESIDELSVLGDMIGNATAQQVTNAKIGGGLVVEEQGQRDAKLLLGLV